MKILHVADIHINLHKKKIPYEWQTNRFKLLFDKLLKLEKNCDVVVLAGDIFDRKPEPDEICLFLSYANAVAKPTLAIPGNHEATAKGHTFLEHFEQDYAINNPNFILKTKNSRTVIDGVGFQFFPYGEMQLGNIPQYIEGDILIAHIRGEVPPHITAEFDFDKISKWPLVLLGDLHFYHKYKDYAAYYSGSPINTTFDRDASREYGVNIIEFNSASDYAVNFVSLDLPKLVRHTVDANTELKKDEYHHVVYEVTGTIDRLSKIENHELLDKKIAEKPQENSILDLRDKNLKEELEAYLDFIKIENKNSVIGLFETLGVK